MKRLYVLGFVFLCAVTMINTGILAFSLLNQPEVKLEEDVSYRFYGGYVITKTPSPDLQFVDVGFEAYWKPESYVTVDMSRVLTVPIEPWISVFELGKKYRVVTLYENGGESIVWIEVMEVGD